jgi:hypothetical protein
MDDQVYPYGNFILDENTPESHGYLIVNVATARGAIPVEGATVIIRPNAEFGDNGGMFSIKSNYSGVTEKIALPAPRRHAQHPHESSKPYASYNIEVRKPGFTTVENVNVPIYDTLTSIQPVELVPEAEFSRYAPEPIRINVIPDIVL